MTRKESKPQVTPTQSEAEQKAAMVRAGRQAKREAKEAAAKAKVVKKPVMGPHGNSRKNAFGIAASASKATAVSRSIISRARGGRGR